MRAFVYGEPIGFDVLSETFRGRYLYDDPNDSCSCYVVIDENREPFRAGLVLNVYYRSVNRR